jgi:hypothetical protein
MTTIMTRAAITTIITITIITMTTIMTRAAITTIITITITMTTIMTRAAAVAALQLLPPAVAAAKAMCLWLYHLIQIWPMNPMMRRIILV